MTRPEPSHPVATHKSKTLATWIAVIGGSLGLHRFYLHGLRDLPGWLHPLPTSLGLYGVQRAREIGQDDHLAWVLMPLLGCTVVAAMLAAIVYGLTSDEKWNARFRAFDITDTPAHSGWGAILGVMLALLVGAGVLMATIAFAGQRYFEYQVETERVAFSPTAPAPAPPPDRPPQATAR